MNCAMCGIHACRNGLEGAPKSCPSLDKDLIDNTKELYKTEENYTIAKISTKLSPLQERTRIEETMDFAKQCGYKKIGLAFCNALANEAKIIDKVFSYNGFETESIICKVGAISRETVDLEHSSNSMCNPIVQAELLNKAKTDLNVVIGLCVGHDSLFIKYSKAPVTVLAVKDKVLAHNPLGAIYMADKYYKNRLFPPKDEK